MDAKTCRTDLDKHLEELAKHGAPYRVDAFHVRHPQYYNGGTFHNIGYVLYVSGHLWSGAYFRLFDQIGRFLCQPSPFENNDLVKTLVLVHNEFIKDVDRGRQRQTA